MPATIGFLRRRPLFRFFATTLGALSLFALISCILGGDKVAKRGSEVENELGVYGALVDEGGKPVVGATVKAKPSASGVGKISAGRSAQADSDSVVTDSTGKYFFRKLAAGDYDVYGDFQSGSLVVLIPGVALKDIGHDLDIGIDTLRAPGRIRGQLLLGDKGKNAVLCYVPGTSYLAVSDDSGRFVLSGVPQGKYSVSYSLAGLVLDPDSGVVVRSGKTTDLPIRHLAYDPALPPPAPMGLKVQYDTLNEKVLLTWESVPVSDLDGYVVYRDDPSFLDPKVVAGGFTKQTTFTDSTFKPFDLGGRKSLVYRVKARDLEVNVSVSYSTPAYVEVVSRSYATTILSMESQGAKSNAVSIGDSLRLSVKYSNPGRSISEIDWISDATQSVLRTRADSSSSGTDTLRIKAGNAGMEAYTVKVIDNAGTTWKGNISISVLQDSPKPFAGTDTAVSVGDLIHLHGKASDGFGEIKSLAWDIGNTGNYRVLAGGDTTFAAPGTPATIQCMLKAIDDDGNVAIDTMLAQVLQDVPKASLGSSSLPDAFTNDTVLLSGAASSDGFGKIVKFEWDLGTGIFVSASGTDTVMELPSAAGEAVRIRLRVTDDDGNTAMDSISFNIHLRGGREWLLATAVAPFKPRMGSKMLDFKDRLWVIAGYNDKSGGYLGDVWSSANGSEWTQATAMAPFGARYDHAAIVYNGKMWVIGGTHGGPMLTDVWNSEDGVNWTQVTAVAPFAGRSSPGLMVFGGKMWIVGGLTIQNGDKLVNDVWSSTNGKDWTLETANGGFPARARHGAFIFQDKMWIAGGWVKDAPGGDIWNSSDGKNWVHVVDLDMLNRHFPAVLVLDRTVWMFGGWSGNSLKDVWSSTDGATWTEAVQKASYGARADHAATVFKGKMWMMGGFGVPMSGMDDDYGDVLYSK